MVLKGSYNEHALDIMEKLEKRFEGLHEFILDQENVPDHILDQIDSVNGLMDKLMNVLLQQEDRIEKLQDSLEKNDQEQKKRLFRWW